MKKISRILLLYILFFAGCTNLRDLDIFNQSDGEVPPGTPVVTITSPENYFATNGSSVTVKGAAVVDDATITKVSLTVNGTNTLAVQGTGTWSVQVNLETGTNSLVAQAESSAGRSASSQPLTVIRDAAAPAIYILSPADSSTNSTSLTLAVYSHDELSSVKSVTVLTNDVFYTNVSNPLAFADIGISDLADLSFNTLSVFADDRAGNRSTTNSITVYCDSSVPSVSIDAKFFDMATNETAILVTGDASIVNPFKLIQRVEISADNGATFPWGANYNLSSVSWSLPVSLQANQTNFVQARAMTDDKTNYSSVAAIIVDTEAPVAEFAGTWPTGDTNSSSSMTYLVNISDNLSEVDSQYYRVDGGSPIAFSGYSFTVNDYEEGRHIVDVFVRDKAGNWSQTNSQTNWVDFGESNFYIYGSISGNTLGYLLGVAAYAPLTASVVSFPPTNAVSFAYALDVTSLGSNTSVYVVVFRDNNGNGDFDYEDSLPTVISGAEDYIRVAEIQLTNISNYVAVTLRPQAVQGMVSGDALVASLDYAAVADYDDKLWFTALIQTSGTTNYWLDYYIPTAWSLTTNRVLLFDDLNTNRYWNGDSESACKYPQDFYLSGSSSQTNTADFIINSYICVNRVETDSDTLGFVLGEYIAGEWVETTLSAGEESVRTNIGFGATLTNEVSFFRDANLSGEPDTDEVHFDRSTVVTTQEAITNKWYVKNKTATLYVTGTSVIVNKLAVFTVGQNVVSDDSPISIFGTDIYILANAWESNTGTPFNGQIRLVCDISGNGIIDGLDFNIATNKNGLSINTWSSDSSTTNITNYYTY